MKKVILWIVLALVPAVSLSEWPTDLAVRKDAYCVGARGWPEGMEDWLASQPRWPSRWGEPRPKRWDPLGKEEDFADRMRFWVSVMLVGEDGWTDMLDTWYVPNTSDESSLDESMVGSVFSPGNVEFLLKLLNPNEQPRHRWLYGSFATTQPVLVHVYDREDGYMFRWKWDSSSPPHTLSSLGVLVRDVQWVCYPRSDQ